MTRVAQLATSSMRTEIPPFDPVWAAGVILGFASERAKRVAGSLGKIGPLNPVLLRHVIGLVRYGRGRKRKYKCWKQSLYHCARMMHTHDAAENLKYADLIAISSTIITNRHGSTRTLISPLRENIARSLFEL